MAVDLCKLLVEDNAKEFDFEATFFCSSHGDISRVLTTGSDHMELLLLVIVEEGTDCDSSARLLSILVLSDFFECLWMKQLDIAIS